MLNELNETLGDLIKSGKYPSKGGKNPFINFNRLAYQLSTGFTEKELIKNRRILKGKQTYNYLTDKEKLKLKEIEKKIVFLLNKGLVYKEIKQTLLDNKT